MGVEVEKVHRIITFHQSPFFEPYISFNSEERAKATSDFSKDFFKLKNNSLFGKTMENVRGRMDMRLCQTAEKMRTYTSKPLFQSCKVFGPDLVGVQILKKEVRSMRS
jgi:hypothetical protein